MPETSEQIEIRIAYLERANAELGDVVYQQRKDIEALRARLSELVGRLEASQSEPSTYSAQDEKPPHY